MRDSRVLTSVTRISDLAEAPFDVGPLARDRWQTGDYVAGSVLEVRGARRVAELPTGRIADLMTGDVVVGALGRRTATLETVGDWQLIDDDGTIHVLTPAGLLGIATSRSVQLGPITRINYEGHVMRDGVHLRMSDFVRPEAVEPFAVPTILIIGTSMSAGKTTAARLIISLLTNAGLRVVGAKMTGAARYRDILSMQDAGADAIFDFVDAGLPSTVCEPDVFRSAGRRLLSYIAAEIPDLAVIEAGASPLEPYNGETAMELLKGNLACTVLCASDPYAVLGVMHAFGVTPDLVSGVAAATTSAVRLVEKLTGVPALNVLDEASRAPLEAFLKEKLAGL